MEINIVKREKVDISKKEAIRIAIKQIRESFKIEEHYYTIDGKAFFYDDRGCTFKVRDVTDADNAALEVLSFLNKELLSSN